MEPCVKEKLELLCSKLKQAMGTHEVVNVGAAVMALTTDIITEYCFGKSYGFLEKPGFAPEWEAMIMGAAEMSNLGRYFPWLPIMMAKMPPWMVKLIDASMVPLVVFTKDQEKQVQQAKTELTADKASGNRRIILHDLLESDLPASEKSVKRLAQESQTLVSAGSITTMHHLKTTIYFVLANPDIHDRLKAELKTAIPDRDQIPQLHALQKLPFLAAVVKEGSRMTYGISSRMARVAPNQELKYRDWIMPAGTSISMTHALLLNNPEVFPEPKEFRPERWLSGGRELDKFLINFGRGARSCLGINLAQVEIYPTLAALFRRFDFELFETDRGDVDMAHDFFVPYARIDSKGIRVLVKSCDR